MRLLIPMITRLRLLRKTLLRPPQTLLLHPGSHPFFSATFRRTPCMHHQYSSLPHPFPFPNLPPLDPIPFLPQTTEFDEPGIARLVESAKKGKGFGLLDECGVEGNEGVVCGVIWGLRDDWEVALMVFRWGEGKGWCGAKALGLVVWVLGYHHKFRIAWGLIRGSGRSSKGARMAMLVMIERYAAAGYPQKAIKTFEVMENIRASPDHTAFYTLLSALCKNVNVEDAENFMLNNQKMFPLETDGFNIILHGWSSVINDVCEAKRVWRDMSRCCITPNAVSYTLMISCFSRARKLFDTLKLYDEMKKKGWVPDIEVYNSLIYVLANENCLDEALNIMKKIKEMGLRPDATTYNSLISPLCKAEKFEEARELLAAMVEYDIAPTIATYNAFLETANVENSLAILNEMKIAGLGPDRDSFLLLFDKFFRLRQPENALKMWVEMENYGVERESAHYIAIVKGLVNCGCLVKARELHTEMASKPILQDPKLERLLKERLRGSRLHRAQCMSGIVARNGIHAHHRRPIIKESKRRWDKIQKRQSTG